VVPAYFLFECAEQALETIALEYRRILRAPHGQLAANAEVDDSPAGIARMQQIFENDRLTVGLYQFAVHEQRALRCGLL